MQPETKSEIFSKFILMTVQIIWSKQPEYTFYLEIGPCNLRPKVKYFQIYTHDSPNRSMQPEHTFYLPIGPCNRRPKVKYFQNLYS